MLLEQLVALKQEYETLSFDPDVLECGDDYSVRYVDYEIYSDSYSEYSDLI